MLDETYSAARAEYARTILAILINIEDWIVIDSWLGGGKAADTKRREEFGQAYAEFRAVATVVSMTAEKPSRGGSAGNIRSSCYDLFRYESHERNLRH
jgi:hypothetical protein